MQDIELGILATHDGTVPDPEPHRKPPIKSKQPNKTESLEEKQTQNAEKKRPGKWRSRLYFTEAPGFIEYCSIEWPDLLTILLLMLIPILIFEFVPPLTTKYFLLEQNGVLVTPQYAYPQLDEYINTWVSAVLSFMVPFAFMGLVAIFLIGDFWDSNSAIMGLSFALCTADLFQIIIKWVIGGLRPHFYHACLPVPTAGGIGHNLLYYDRTICTGDRREIDIALMSFPSGHSTAAFAGFIFTALHWQQILLATPVLFAILIALSKIVDHYHHWYDVLVGAMIGASFAMISYRMCYAAVFDWRCNHIPLPYCYKGDPRSSSEQRPVEMTRKLTAINMAGWENKHTKRSEGNSHDGTEKTVDKEISKADGGEPKLHTPALRREQGLSRLDGADTKPSSSSASSIAQFDGFKERKMDLCITGVAQMDGADEVGNLKLKKWGFDMTQFLV